MKKSSPVSLRVTFGVLLTLSLVLSAGMAGRYLTLVHAQSATPQRMVQGKVIDKADKPLKGAVVYLKDTHSLAVKSSITPDEGTFRFSQLAGNVDYELWAESDGKKSNTRTISSFDNKNKFDIDLKVDK
jgi:hypothetical protein